MIQTQSLCFQYATGPALVFPDVQVAQASVLLLSGPSGSGKSTWLALVAGLMAPASGGLTVAEQDLNALKNIASDAWRAKAIGFLPQKLHLSAGLTVQQNMALAYWASGNAENPQRIAQTLAALDVLELADRLPAQLSGGQAQRVALARALLLKPQVILADEPTASLDDDAASDAVRLLLTQARLHAATLVIASHDARVATLISQDIIAKNSLQRLVLKHQKLSNQ